MVVKVEHQSGSKLPKNLIIQAQNILKALPREHTIGLDRIIFVEEISQLQFRSRLTTGIPGLYHPKQATKPAFIEISTSQVTGKNEPLYKRLILKMTTKNNLAALIISLVGQHYYSTLRHSVKRSQMEPSIKAYSNKYMRLWSQRENRIRTRLFKPLEPMIMRLERKMRHAAAKQRTKS